MTKPLKPWRSFADQLQQLQDRWLQVDNPTAAFDYLERLGYYRLSGYWYPLRTIELFFGEQISEHKRWPAVARGIWRRGWLESGYALEKPIPQMKTDAYTECRGVDRIARILGRPQTSVKPRDLRPGRNYKGGKAMLNEQHNKVFP